MGGPLPSKLAKWREEVPKKNFEGGRGGVEGIVWLLKDENTYTHARAHANTYKLHRSMYLIKRKV